MTNKAPDLVTLFKMLGVDIEDTTQVNELRADLVNARRLRRAGEAGRRHAWKVLVTAVVLALITGMADTVRRWVVGLGG